MQKKDSAHLFAIFHSVLDWSCT